MKGKEIAIKFLLASLVLSGVVSFVGVDNFMNESLHFRPNVQVNGEQYERSDSETYVNYADTIKISQYKKNGLVAFIVYRQKIGGQEHIDYLKKQSPKKFGSNESDRLYYIQEEISKRSFIVWISNGSIISIENKRLGKNEFEGVLSQLVTENRISDDLGRLIDGKENGDR